MSTSPLEKIPVVLLALALLLGASGCMNYWKDVDKLQEENFVAEDQLKWEGRDEAAKDKEAAEANAPADAPLKPSDY